MGSAKTRQGAPAHERGRNFDPRVGLRGESIPLRTRNCSWGAVSPELGRGGPVGLEIPRDMGWELVCSLEPVGGGEGGG